MGLRLLGPILFATLPPARLSAATEGDSIHEMRSVEVVVRHYTSPIRLGANGMSKWNLRAIQDMPQIMGNADPLNMTELLPGVQTTSEYDAGIHIWGSENSHNDISLDGTPVYGVQHLLGFFSVFNSSHFDFMTYAPSTSMGSCANRIGGMIRMESITTVPEHITGEVMMGPMSSQGTIRVPILSRTALVLSAREAYLNLLYKRWLLIDDEQMRYNFGDYNLTLLHECSSRNRLRLNFYAGHDHVGLENTLSPTEVKLRWMNQLVSIDHTHSFGENGGFTQALSYSRYSSTLKMLQEGVDLKGIANIQDWSYRGEIQWKEWQAGINATAWHIQPQKAELTRNAIVNRSEAPLQHTREVSLYAGYSWALAHRWTLHPTLKGIAFRDDSHEFHLLPSPSLTVKWQTAKAGTLRLHYAWQHQSLFQVGHTTTGMPTEYWLAAGRYGKPQEAQHISLSHEITFLNNQWGWTFNVYYKHLHNQLEYNGNVLDFLSYDYDLQQSLLYGKGFNYGVNAMVVRRTGAISGWISYAYNRSSRQFDDPDYPSTYPSNHERPHEVNAVLNWRISRHWNIGGTFTYCSGTPYTALRHIYLINHTLLVEQGEHNAQRLKAYKRLDLSVNYDLRNTLRHESGINISLYNALGFDNELYYRLRIYNGYFSYRPKQFMLPMLPSISFYYKWK